MAASTMNASNQIRTQKPYRLLAIHIFGCDGASKLYYDSMFSQYDLAEHWLASGPGDVRSLTKETVEEAKHAPPVDETGSDDDDDEEAHGNWKFDADTFDFDTLADVRMALKLLNHTVDVMETAARDETIVPLILVYDRNSGTWVAGADDECRDARVMGA